MPKFGTQKKHTTHKTQFALQNVPTKTYTSRS